MRGFKRTVTIPAVYEPTEVRISADNSRITGRQRICVRRNGGTSSRSVLTWRSTTFHAPSSHIVGEQEELEILNNSVTMSRLESSAADIAAGDTVGITEILNIVAARRCATSS